MAFIKRNELIKLLEDLSQYSKSEFLDINVNRVSGNLEVWHNKYWLGYIDIDQKQFVTFVDKQPK